MKLTTYDFNEQPVRALLDQNGEPWFVAADVCRVLEIQNATQAVQQLDADDLCNTEVIDSMGRTQKANVISEAGLYQLVFTSRKPEARTFKRWVTKEVLPAIRKHGCYVAAEAVALTSAPEAETPALPEPTPWTLDALIKERSRVLQLMEVKLTSGTLESGTAQAFLGFIVEGRKQLELQARERCSSRELAVLPPPPPVEVGPEWIRLFESAAGELRTDGSYSAPGLARIARFERIGLSELASGLNVFGRKLKACCGRMMRDRHGRAFGVEYIKDYRGIRYVFQFVQPEQSPPPSETEALHPSPEAREEPPATEAVA